MHFEELKIRLAALYLYRRRDLTQDLTQALRDHRVLHYAQPPELVRLSQPRSIHHAHQALFQQLSHLSCAVFPTGPVSYNEAESLAFNIQTFTRVHNRLYGYYEHTAGIRFLLGQWVNGAFNVKLYQLSDKDTSIPAAVEHAAQHITLAIRYDAVDYTPAEYTLLMIRPFVQHVTGQSFSTWEKQSACGLRLMTQRWFDSQIRPAWVHRDLQAASVPQERLFLCFTLAYLLGMHYSGETLWRVVNNLLVGLMPEIEHCERELFGQIIR